MKMRNAKKMIQREAMAPENMDTTKKMAMEKKMGFKAFTPAVDKKKKTPKPLPKPSYQNYRVQSTDPGSPQTAPTGQWKYNVVIK